MTAAQEHIGGYDILLDGPTSEWVVAALDRTLDQVALLRKKYFDDLHQFVAGLTLDESIRQWISQAVDLRISPRGNDGQEAVETVLEIVRAFAVERATAIVIERRQRTVEREMKADAASRRELRRRARERACIRGDRISVGMYARGEFRQKGLP